MPKRPLNEPPAKVNKQTRQLLNRLAKRGYTRCAIGVRDRRIKECIASYADKYKPDWHQYVVWAGPRTAKIYSVVDEVGMKNLSISDLTPGRYKYRQGRWYVAKD